MDYQLKRQLRINHYEELAAKAQKEALELLRISNEFSQKVYKKYSDNELAFLVRKGKSPIHDIYVILDQRDHYSRVAERYTHLAEYVRTDTAIYSDDPNALEKLQARLAQLESRKQAAKDEINELKAQGYSIDLYRDPAGFNRAIRRVKERIYKVEQIQKSKVYVCKPKHRPAFQKLEGMVV